MRIFFIPVILLFIIIVGIFLFKSQQLPQSFPQVVQNIKEPLQAASNVTLIPFAELTIPYLRSRKYESQLGELNKYQDRATYTSYLTSYYSDGLKINGLLTQPKGDMPEGGWPAIVFVHGYIAPTTYRTTEKYVEYIDNLARNGFVVFKIDLRGHGDSEGRPSGAYMSGDYIIDTLNAYAALEKSDFVNPKKIGLWGHSMAGNVTMRSFAAKPDIPVVVIWGGAVYSYTDREKYGISDNSYRPPTNNVDLQQKRKELTEKYGEFKLDSLFWKTVAPTNYLNDLKGAIQLNHAVDDNVVNVGYSRDLDALLDQTSVVHELNEYPNGGHNITGASFTKAMQNTVRFYKEHLGE